MTTTVIGSAQRPSIAHDTDRWFNRTDMRWYRPNTMTGTYWVRCSWWEARRLTRQHRSFVGGYR